MKTKTKTSVYATTTMVVIPVVLIVSVTVAQLCFDLFVKIIGWVAVIGGIAFVLGIDLVGIWFELRTYFEVKLRRRSSDLRNDGETN